MVLSSAATVVCSVSPYHYRAATAVDLHAVPVLPMISMEPRWVSPRHDTVDPLPLPSRNPIICHEEVSSGQPMIPPKRFDHSPPLPYLGDAQKAPTPLRPHPCTTSHVA